VIVVIRLRLGITVPPTFANEISFMFKRLINYYIYLFIVSTIYLRNCSKRGQDFFLSRAYIILYTHPHPQIATLANLIR
jgi:hypothetical protein